MKKPKEPENPVKLFSGPFPAFSAQDVWRVQEMIEQE
jgi:hypothetical protein